MNVIVHIPDDIAGRLSAGGGDLSRRALEAFLAEEYRHDRLTRPELQRLLGIETSYELDGFLKAHDIWIEYTPGTTPNANDRVCNAWASDAFGRRRHQPHFLSLVHRPG
jgi:hypothetical protein